MRDCLFVCLVKVKMKYGKKKKKVKRPFPPKVGVQEAPLSFVMRGRAVAVWLWMEMSLKCQLPSHVWVLAPLLEKDDLLIYRFHLPLPFMLPLSSWTSFRSPPPPPPPPLFSPPFCHLNILLFEILTLISPSIFFLHSLLLRVFIWPFQYQWNPNSGRLHLSGQYAHFILLPNHFEPWVIFLLKNCMQITLCGEQARRGESTVQEYSPILLPISSPNCLRYQNYPPRQNPFIPNSAFIIAILWSYLKFNMETFSLPFLTHLAALMQSHSFGGFIQSSI